MGIWLAVRTLVEIKVIQIPFDHLPLFPNYIEELVNTRLDRVIQSGSLKDCENFNPSDRIANRRPGLPRLRG
jgi:hypothetical protein